MSPSRLNTSTSRFLQGPARARSASRSAAEQVSRRDTLSSRGPFLGLQSDVDPNLTDGTAFTHLQNVLARAHGEDHGEVLGLPDGYRQLSSATLPLGDTTPPAAVADADPVLRLDQLGRVSPTGGTTPGDLTGEFQLTPMAVTGQPGFDQAAAGPPSPGNMYRINAAGAWVQVAESVATSDARALRGRRDGRTTSPSMPDSCVAPFGATARAVTTAAPNDDGQSGNIQEPAWIFTNDVDEVMVFPSTTVGAAGTIAGVHEYEALTNVAALDSGGANGFRCKSVETWNGRVYFLNTSEAGTRRQQRLRRTAKFTCDPDPAIVGAGFFDFREFQGEGLRIETLGDVLAVYFSDGVAFLRPTGVPTSPDESQILSTERGLLSTHAVTSIGRNVHFGIFTDGWWRLDQSGRWQEVGVVNLNGKVVPKWRQSFYEEIPATQRHRLYVYYDQPNNLIYIARPTVAFPEPREVWIYDPTSDRVFIENYPVTCFGTFTPQTQAGVTIDALPGTIDSLAGTIDSFAPIIGFPKARVHGDLNGFVYQHRRDLVGFDSAASPPAVQNPEWSYSLGVRSPGGMRNVATVDRVSLEYFDHGNTANVSVKTEGPSGSQTRSVVLSEGVDDEAVRVRDAWFRYSDRGLGLQVSGVGEFHIRAHEIDLWVDPVEPRGL